MRLGLGISLAVASAAAPWTPASLFAGADGAYLLPFGVGSVYADSAGTTRVRTNESVKRVADLSGNGRHATISASDSTCRYMVETATSAPYIRQSMQDDAERLAITFGGSLGSDCTIVYVNRATVEFREGQTVGSTYEIPKSFFGLLIIGRALTAGEKAQLRSYFAAYCPHYVTEADMAVWVDPDRADDTGDGLTQGTAKKTLQAGWDVLKALATGSKMGVLGGTVTAGVAMPATAITKAQAAYIFEPLTVDIGQVFDNSGGNTSAFACDAASYTFDLFGEGNLTIQNAGNNGYGMANSCNAGLWDARLTHCYDGVTAHQTSTSRAFGLTIDYIGKGQLAHVNTTTNSGEHLVVYMKEGTALGVQFGDRGVAFDYYQCDFLPDPATVGTDWDSFLIKALGAGADTPQTIANRKIRSSRFGAPHLTPVGLGSSLCNTWNTAWSDCYFNGIRFASPQTGAQESTFDRCFGPAFTYRPRWTSTNVVRLRHCAFTSGIPTADRIVAADFFASGTDEFGAGEVSNTILKNAAAGIFVTSNTATFNTNWSLLNNALHGNTLNMTAGVTADGTDITSDPLLIAPTTDMQADWAVNTNSPCVGAGTSGSNIGFTAADLAA